MAADLLSAIRAEIEDRLSELRPALAEYEGLLDAAEALDREHTTQRRAARAAAVPTRARRGAAREAILAALEHGSHTVAELALVTGMSAANINGNLRRLLAEGAVAKAQREGRTAYALAQPAPSA